ncbi:hypothetical protein ACS5PJ_14380 [Pseudarthrobacter sp. YS3]|uniref:hypothetical protein n=1 Tax=Pseudarthrobacter sp. YS3 TaxID=3453718 RepID=UPI003EEA1C40
MDEAVDLAKIPYRHGPAGPSLGGYRKGCRCAGCKKCKREDMAKYRAGKKPSVTTADRDQDQTDSPEIETPSLAMAWDAPAGPIETALLSELAALIGEPPFKKTLLEMAKYNARVLDQIPAMERPDLISGMQSRLFNMFDRLRKTEAAAGATDSWDLSALLQVDD